MKITSLSLHTLWLLFSIRSYQVSGRAKNFRSLSIETLDPRTQKSSLADNGRALGTVRDFLRDRSETEVQPGCEPDRALGVFIRTQHNRPPLERSCVLSPRALTMALRNGSKSVECTGAEHTASSHLRMLFATEKSSNSFSRKNRKFLQNKFHFLAIFLINFGVLLFKVFDSVHPIWFGHRSPIGHRRRLVTGLVLRIAGNALLGWPVLQPEPAKKASWPMKSSGCLHTDDNKKKKK